MGIGRSRSWTRTSSSKVWSQETFLLSVPVLIPQLKFLPYPDPALGTRGNGETKLLHTREDCPRPGGRNSRSTAGTVTDREVTLNALLFVDAAELLGRIDGINAVGERRDGGEKGLGEFQRRSNRDRRYEQRNWDQTPRSERGGSVRVPNVGWESTPRNSRSDGGGWGRVGNRSWDAQTPRVVRDTSPDGDDRAFGLDSREWEEEQVRLDRDWYTGAEEGGVAGDEENNPLSQYEDLTANKEAEIASKQIVRSPLFSGFLVLSFSQKKVSARQAQYVSRNLCPPIFSSNPFVIQNADNDLWESNRMVTSGVATRQAIDLDFEDESESTVHVMVHDLKPPFLDGRTVFTKQLDPINPIRDPTSDLAVFSRKGSALVKEKREQAERAKAAAKMAALSGTSLGNIMGVKDEEGEGASSAITAAMLCWVDIHEVFLFLSGSRSSRIRKT